MNVLRSVSFLLLASSVAFAQISIKEAVDAVNKLGYGKQYDEARALAFSEMESRTNLFERIQLLERAAHFYRYGKAEYKQVYATNDIPKLLAFYNEALASAPNPQQRDRWLGAIAERQMDLKDYDAVEKTVSQLGNKATAYDYRGKIAYVNKNWDGAISNFMAAVEFKRNPKRIMSEAWESILNVTRAGRHAEAQEYCRKVRSLPEIDPASVIKSYEIEARSYRAEKVFEKVPPLIEEVFGSVTNYSAGNIVEFCKLMTPQLTDIGELGFKASYDFLERVIAEPEKYRVDTVKDKLAVIEIYRARAWRGMDRDRTAKAHEMAEKLGKKYPDSELSKQLVRYWTEMKSFPKDEKEIKIPSDLQDFGADPNRKVVHAKDFGWNPTNATECLQKAFDSDASTVIVDDMGSPWYIWSVDLNPGPCSNRKIIFKKGVVVLSAPEHGRKDEPGWYRKNMFTFHAPTNLVIVGEGDYRNKDVYIGKYRNRAERLAAGWEYGGNGFGGSCRNVLIKNLFIANCGQDALAWGGKNSFVVDCIFDDNFRQGMSLGGSENCVYKNVTFSNTFGGEPHNGVDFEPYYEIYSCPNHYFFDCKFFNNAAGNLIFATSTYAPMTAYFKRCEFEANANQNITIHARAGIYMDAKVKAPSNIIFEDCRMDGYADSTIIKFSSSFLYDVTFRNCVMNEKGLFRKGEKATGSPITLNLDRKIYDGFYPNAGVVTFENVKINGYKGKELIKVLDSNGRYGVNTFRGEIDFNGEKVDMSKFSYLPPDLELAEVAEPDLAEFNEPASEFTRGYVSPFRFNFGHAYYNPRMAADMLVWGQKGKTVSFRIRQKCRAKQDATFNVKTPDGKIENLGSAKEGVNEYKYTFAADGLYRFDPNFPTWAFDDEILDEGFIIEEVKGAAPAYYPAGTRLGHELKINTGDDFPKYIGYFEVPGGKECWLKVMGGGIEICDAEGNVVHHLETADYGGSKCLKFKTASGKNEIWSFRMLDGYLSMKFFDPLPGVWADDPEWLPTIGEDLPFHRVAKEFSSTEEIPNAVLFPIPLKGKYAEIAEAAAKKREEMGNGNEWAKKYANARHHYDWQAPAAQTQEELAVAAAELESMEPLRKMRDMEKAAKRESEDLRRYVAFVQTFVPVLVMEKDEFREYLDDIEEADLDEDVIEAVNAKIGRYGVELMEEGLYYSDYAGIMKLAPIVAKELELQGEAK